MAKTKKSTAGKSTRKAAAVLAEILAPVPVVAATEEKTTTIMVSSKTRDRLKAWAKKNKKKVGATGDLAIAEFLKAHK